MAEPGKVDVDWIGGPYDGADFPLPLPYRQAAFIDLPDPATAADHEGTDEPAIHMGPTHRYRLEVRGQRLAAHFVS